MLMRQKWEYDNDTCPVDQAKEAMNKRGENGWELANMQPATSNIGQPMWIIIWKRPKGLMDG